MKKAHNRDSKRKRSGELKVVQVKEALCIKRLNRHVGVWKRSFYLIYNGKKIDITEKQGARFVKLFRNSKQPDYALEQLIGNLGWSSSALYDDGSPFACFTFDKVRTGHLGNRVITSFAYKRVLQTKGKDGEEKTEKPGNGLENPGSLGTHETCWRETTE